MYKNFYNPKILGSEHRQSLDLRLRKWVRIPGFGILGLESLVTVYC